MNGTAADGRPLRVCMLLDNHHAPDPRVQLECQALSRAGAVVRVIAWDRRSPYQRQASEMPVMPPGVEIVRIPVEAPAGGGRSTFVAMLRFARAVWRRRAELTAGANLLIAHDIYLLPLARALALRLRLPFVYDAHEEYAAMEAQRYPGWWLRLASVAETRLARRAAAVVVPGESRTARWRDARGDRPVLLRNLGSDECNVPADGATPQWDIAYCGTLAEVRRLDLLLEVARRRPDVRIVIAGRGRGEADIERAARQLGNVEFRGWTQDADEIVRSSRAIYYGLDPSHPYAAKACPNTLYDAVRLGRPLLYFCGGDVAEIARRFRIGVRCEASPESLIEGLEAIRAPGARWDFGAARAHLWTSGATEPYVTAILSAASPRGPHRSSMARWRRIVLVGPHPVRVARTLGFLARRRVQRRWLRHRYDTLVAGHKWVGPVRYPRVDLCDLPELPRDLRAPAQALIGEADEVLRHRVDFLGSGMVELGERIDWHTDFKSGHRWEPRFYQDVEITRLDDSSDAKVPWELSRGHHMLTLARAARLTGEEVYLAALVDQLEAWLDSNRPGRGINWVTPMELGIRAVNWLWIMGTLADAALLPRDLERRMAGALHWHARHIRSNLEGTPYLRSNHYLGDILGLLAVGLAFPEDPAGRRWADHAAHAFEREIRRQVHADGVGFEGSLAYHGLCMEMFLVARRLTHLAGRRMSAGYEARLASMLKVSLAVRHGDGRIPQFGDQDSGRVLPAGFARSPTHDSLLWLGSAVLELDAPLPGPPDSELAWTLGLEAYERMANAPLRSPDLPSHFPVGGLYVLRGHGTHVVVRCGDVGQAGAGGHAHNDLLSFEASFGVPIVVDSGTYAYTFDIAARHAMRRSSAHNVTLVDQHEINPLDEREVFRLAQVAHPTIHEWSETDDEVRLVVSHDGYRRLPTPVVVRRTFELRRASGQLVVHDELLGTGRHVVESFLHLAPGTAVERTEGGMQVHRNRWVVRVGTGVATSAVDIRSGWVSDRYGSRELAPLLAQQRRAELPTVVSWTFEPLDAADRLPSPAVATVGRAPSPMASS